MKKFEYVLTTAQSIEQMQVNGDDGWELVAVVPPTHGHGYARWYWKREKHDN